LVILEMLIIEDWLKDWRWGTAHFSI